MTKREPDQVIEYRISLQDKLNEQVDGIIAAYQINKVATPLVALLSDTSAMLLITGVLEATGVIDLDKGILREIGDDTVDLLVQFVLEADAVLDYLVRFSLGHENAPARSEKRDRTCPAPRSQPRTKAKALSTTIR